MIADQDAIHGGKISDSPRSKKGSEDDIKSKEDFALWIIVGFVCRFGSGFARGLKAGKKNAKMRGRRSKPWIGLKISLK
jgi:hypothetical protein